MEDSGGCRAYKFYNRIQDVTLAQGWIDRLFGLAAVVVETAGGEPLLPLGFLKAPDAERVKDFLIEKARLAHGRA